MKSLLTYIMLKINNLRKNFGEKTAVDIDNFTVNNGDILGLVGNNGAGKTTLFRLILDLLKADEGEVLIRKESENETDGSETYINPAQTEEWKDFTGAFINDGFLIDFLTPEEYFEFIGKVAGIDKTVCQEKLKEYDDFMAGEIMGQKKLIRDLSAGNKQKVGIIAALLGTPRLVVLDEPFNFLDPSSQNILKTILKEYSHKTGATMLVSSHNLTHTVDISTCIALMEQGKIIRNIRNENTDTAKELEEYFNKQA